MEKTNTMQGISEAAAAVQDDPACQAYLNEPLPQAGQAEAIVKVEEDHLSSSPVDMTAIERMPADELHKEIIATYVSLGDDAIMYQALVFNARCRMGKGEKVGGCGTWKDYADCYLKRHDETLPTCLRRLRRALEGTNPDTKHDGSKQRRKTSKSNAQIVEEGLERQHAIEKKAEYEKGFSDGEKAGIKKAEFAAAKKPKQRAPASVPPSLTGETYYIIRRKSDGALWFGRVFLILPNALGKGKQLTISDVAHFQSPEKEQYEKVLRITKRLCKQAEKPFDADGYEWIKVVAAYTLTTVAVQP